METTPETDALLADLFDRCAVVEDLDGPQIEALVSGLFPVFDSQVTPLAFVEYCAGRPGAIATLVCAAIAELVEGDEAIGSEVGAAAHAVVASSSANVPESLAQIGSSRLTAAWTVTAPFGRSVLLGYTNAIEILDEVGEPRDARHSILVELDNDGALVDLQLSGPAELMTEDAGSVDGRVIVEQVALDEALAIIVRAWPDDADPEQAIDEAGPGIDANQQFVRRRLAKVIDTRLSVVSVVAPPVDVQRGLDDSEYGEANRAALSTLRSALGQLPEAEAGDEFVAAWVGAIRGDGGELSAREREALLWLEWADWLGAGIGLARAPQGQPVDGSILVDFVNRCPEVSSSIDKADREYAEWAFDVALDVLSDAGVLEAETPGKRMLTPHGASALVPALVSAWS